MNANNSNKKKFDVVIVGAGPAGLGVGILLKKLDLDFIILEKNSIGASFKKWPKKHASFLLLLLETFLKCLI